MKQNIWIMTILFLVCLTLLFNSCSALGTQNRYRRDENTPLTHLRPLEVDPNGVINLSPQEFDEYMRRLIKYNDYVRDFAFANGYTAYGEKQWVNDPEGGPPHPPSGFLTSRLGSGEKWDGIFSSL